MNPMELGKERVVHNLLSQKTPLIREEPLVQEIGVEAQRAEIIPSKESEGPSLLEQMMEAQKLAAADSDKRIMEIHQKEAKKSFSGFKKGFFSSKTAASESKKPSSRDTPNEKDSRIDTIRPASNASAKGKASAPLLREVQDSLEREEEEKRANMLLQNKEWLTNDLVATFQNNPILAKGFQSPKCVAAMQMMQANPKEAMTRFRDDLEVSAFLSEFGRVMSDHFTSLSQRKESEQLEESKVSPIQEIGPLQAKVLSGKNTDDAKSNARNSDDEEERVKKILEDEELREMLMDTELQKILMECNDPRQLSFFLQRPEIARKIRRLQSAGLVKIEI